MLSVRHKRRLSHRTCASICSNHCIDVQFSWAKFRVLAEAFLHADVIYSLYIVTPMYAFNFFTYNVSRLHMSRIRGVVANYLASQVRDPGIDSHQHLKDSWHIWRHLRRDTVFSCNLRFRLIFLHGCSRTHCVASLRAVPVGRISYNLYFDCKHVRSVTCDLINEYIFICHSYTVYWMSYWPLIFSLGTPSVISHTCTIFSNR